MIDNVMEPGEALNSRRIAINQFFMDHARAWELFMATLAINSVAVGLLVVEDNDQTLLVSIEWILTLGFSFEYAIRLWAAPNRFHYFKHHLIDLVSIIPPIRGARLLRLLRLLRVASELSSVLSSSRLSAQRKLIGKVALFWLAVVSISSVGMYLAESAENPSVRSIFDAFWWAVVTITTVGYGDVSPVTVEGRLAAGVLMILGIVLFSFLTAALTSAIGSAGESKGTVTARIQELEGLREKYLISEEEYAQLRSQLLGEL